MMKTTVLLLPGYLNSGPDHWQSYLEQRFSNVKRVQQKDWLVPDRQAWVQAITEAVAQTEGDILLVGHSCGSVAIAQWATDPFSNALSHNGRIRGLLLVAPADVDADNALPPLRAQRPLPHCKIPFSTVMLCGDNDDYTDFERSQLFAKEWGCELIVIENGGHLNADAGFGYWPQIETFIEGFTADPILIRCRSFVSED
ncbi:RBBP9/YdeN family alpha/beta hydrolase [Thaumasiovibrio subtropicus]|uniref:RBBP9/YdeN family alpha/beta hydrolase n=1 Tax=Thaumasiovibrio subtropicus TaxID=1891207 RepID=UPI000B35A9C9|nr:alpha/beta hydrolase [Thaumasiovibrio subtropicus]